MLVLQERLGCLLGLHFGEKDTGFPSGQPDLQSSACRRTRGTYAMDEFSQSLQRDHLPEWSDEYLDYQSLQDKVEQAAASNQDEATVQHHKNEVQCELTVSHPGATHDQAYSHPLCAVAAALDKNIKKILSFYRKQESAVQRNVDDLESSYRRTQGSMSDSQTDDKNKRQSCQAHLQKLQTSGEHVSNLLQVCVRLPLLVKSVNVIDMYKAVLSVCTSGVPPAVCELERAGHTQGAEQP